MTPAKFVITITDAGLGFDVIGGEDTDRTVLAVKVYQALFYVLRSPEELVAYLGANPDRFIASIQKQVIREKGDVIVPPVGGLN